MANEIVNEIFKNLSEIAEKIMKVKTKEKNAKKELKK
jgi:hypothetical protein